MTSHKVIIGDSRQMIETKDQSVHFVVTSPPYWQLKDYGHNYQIGFNSSYEEYINHLNLVWKECFRVLHPGCKLCVNIGDQFARSIYYGRYKIIPIRTEIIKFCETIGFDYMGAIIWQKVTTTNTTGGASIMGSFPYPRNGILKLDYEFILIFKKLGISPDTPRDIKEKSKLSIEEWNQYFSGHWNFSGEKQDKHLAMFPEELPKRLIKMFTFVDDVVLDPFLGSGTTTLAAKNLGRNSLGYEINKDFVPVIQEKLGLNSPSLFKKDFSVEILEQKPMKIGFEEEIEKLPYIFKDPIKFDKRVDPRLLKFGSKIDGTEEENSAYYSVKTVLAPNEVILDSGLKVKLLGIKVREEKRKEAIQFLARLTNGQKVFLKFDVTKYDANNELLCYLYLKNKTFLNAHLIKNNLVDVDTSYDYRLKKKFEFHLAPSEIQKQEVS